MTLIPSRGDLFATPGLEALGHGCNCAGSMEKGIAVAFRERWPEMYAAYKARCRERRFGLGDVFLWEQDGVCVFNLGTQKSWRSRAKLPAIRSAVLEMLRLAEARGLNPLNQRQGPLAARRFFSEHGGRLIRSGAAERFRKKWG